MNSGSTSGDGFVKTLPPNGLLKYRPAWLERHAADAVLGSLIEEVEWERHAITMFGRSVPQPRLLHFQGEGDVRYRYSGDTYTARPWHPLVARIRERLEGECGERFNSALLNLYRDGRDSMGWHADDEPELGPEPVIASVSLGSARRFVLRNNDDHRRKMEISPAHGSLIVMGGDLQHHWQHQVPKTRKIVGARVNLTFRKILRRPAHPGARP